MDQAGSTSPSKTFLSTSLRPHGFGPGAGASHSRPAIGTELQDHGSEDVEEGEVTARAVR